ncbi:autotransporter family protein [Bartonella sp. B17]
MTKVLKNHINLCAFTTAIFSLFQNGVAVCANTGNSDADKRGNGSYVITVTPIRSGTSVPNVNHSFEVLGEFSANEYGHYYYPHFNNGSSEYGHNPPNFSGEGITDYGYILIDYYNPNNGVVQKSKDKLRYICDSCKEDSIDNYSFMIMEQLIEGTQSFPAKDPPAIAIEVKGGAENGKQAKKTKVTGKEVTVSSKIQGKSYKRGVSVSKGGEVALTNLTVKNTEVALHVSDGKIEVNGGVIKESGIAVQAIGEPTVVTLNNVKAETKNGQASIYSFGSSRVQMKGESIDFLNSYAAYVMRYASVSFDNVTITGKGEEKNPKNHAAFFVHDGSIDFREGNINVMNLHGMLLKNPDITLHEDALRSVDGDTNSLKLDSRFGSKVHIKKSNVTVKGDGSYGIYFQKDKLITEQDSEQKLKGVVSPKTNIVQMGHTTLVVDDAAIYGGDYSHGVVELSQSTMASKNSLLKAEHGAFIKILADKSVLKGGTRIVDSSIVELYLAYQSKWILQEKLRKDSHNGLSSISSLVVWDSSIDFEKPKSTQDHFYQTLRIGTGKGVVYKTDDKAQIYLNTYLASDDSHDNRQTDRVLIHGSVEGKTTVHVRAVSENSEKYAKNNKDSGGISLIQVSGMAKEDSFELDGGYVALEGSPYAYRLHAQYGEESNLKGDFSKRLVKGEGKFWNFYLKSAYVKPKPDQPKPDQPEFKPEAEKPDSDLGVKVVVPQVPTYLLLPNALFHSGLVDISNLSKRLEIMQTAFGGVLKCDRISAFFVRGYGGNYHYTSDLPVFKYGYGGDLDYNAVEAGVLFKAIESAYGTTSFGVIGTYGKLSLQPVDVEQSKKSAFEKWMLTAYGSMQHDGGAYVNGLVSYGLFQGDVFTRARGKTATLKGHPLNVSVIAGKALMVGSSGLVFDPQVQVVYQHLQFNHAHDIDNFAIKLGNLEQWVTRVGGRLTKTLSAKEDARVLSFYGKLHFAHGFGENKTVHFKDAFQLGAFGSSLEAGLGFHAQLLPKLTLNGDLMYQHKLTKAGFSGATFSGGLRYQF